MRKLFFHPPTAKSTSTLRKTDQAMVGMASMLVEKGWVLTEMTSIPSMAWTTTQIASEAPSTALIPPLSVVAIDKMWATRCGQYHRTSLYGTSGHSVALPNSTVSNYSTALFNLAASSRCGVAGAVISFN